jgi:23S rRNA (guanosine2251-2'-O)-methyltransferase
VHYHSDTTQLQKEIKMKNVSAKKATPRFADFVYGVHACLELLTAKRRKISTVYTTKHEIKSWDKIKKLIPAYTQIQIVDRDVLDKMTDFAQHQGIVIYAAPFPFEKTIFDPKTNPFIVVLDSVQDIGNLGAIIRSAYCAGVDGVVLCSKNSAPLTPAAIKSSAGLSEHTKIFIAPSIGFALQELKNKGYGLYIATLDGAENAATVQFKMPAALVIGNEESGVSKETLKLGTKILLPQRRADISYNASVAAGILMFLMAAQFKKI